MVSAKFAKYAGKKCNLHSHTQFCDGRSTMEEIAVAARDAGFEVLGFTPHAPVGIESPCNMSWDDVDSYMAEIERLRATFPDMVILAGMEVDYLDGERNALSPEIASLGLDYIISSVHFVPNRHGVFYDIDGSSERFRMQLEKYFDNDLDYVVRTFWKQTLDMIRIGGFDIVGHIDKIVMNASTVRADIEDDPDYRRLAAEAVYSAAGSGLAVEINTKHFETKGKFFPNPRYWPELVRNGVFLPVNTDVHDADRISSGRDEAIRILNTHSLL